MFPAFQQGPFLHPLTPPALAIVQEGVGFTVSTASEAPMPISSPWAFLWLFLGSKNDSGYQNLVPGFGS